MSGMEMMLKAMGVDPDEIKQQAMAVRNTVVAFKEQLDRVEGQLTAIQQQLDRIENGKPKNQDGPANLSLGNDS